MICAEHCVIGLMTFLARAFCPRVSEVQELPGHYACMWAGVWGSIFFWLPQHVHVFVRGIKMPNIDKEM